MKLAIWLNDPKHVRAVVLGAWGALSALSLVVAFTRPGGLDAILEREETPNGAVLVVRNDDAEPWTGVHLIVNETWHAQRGVLRHDDTWLVGPLDLVADTYVPLELGDPWLEGAPGLAADRAVPPTDLRMRRARLEVGDVRRERVFEEEP